MSMLVETLGDGDADRRRVAADALVAAGGEAVGPLVAALCVKVSPIGQAGVAVLHRIGEAAFGPLVAALATADDWSVARTLGEALRGLRVPDRDRYLPLLRHASPKVRDAACSAFADLGAEGQRYLPALLPLLADPVGYVAGSASGALTAMGPDVVPVLREIRRSSVPYRRHALTALAEVGGWDALDPADQALVRRLIRTKIPHEVPEPFDCDEWFAIRSDDQAAVLDAFGFCGPTPVTMRLGLNAYGNDRCGTVTGEGTLAYVTPVLDGWTLVLLEPTGDPQHRAAHLSRRFGAAHWYHMFEGYTGWCIAERGEIVRYYDNGNPDRQVGPPHPAEHGYLLPHEDPYPDRAFDDIFEFEQLSASVWRGDVRRAAPVRQGDARCGPGGVHGEVRGIRPRPRDRRQRHLGRVARRRIRRRRPVPAGDNRRSRCGIPRPVRATPAGPRDSRQVLRHRRGGARLGLPVQTRPTHPGGRTRGARIDHARTAHRRYSRRTADLTQPAANAPTTATSDERTAERRPPVTLCDERSAA